MNVSAVYAASMRFAKQAVFQAAFNLVSPRLSHSARVHHQLQITAPVRMSSSVGLLRIGSVMHCALDRPSAVRILSGVYFILTTRRRRRRRRRRRLLRLDYH